MRPMFLRYKKFTVVISILVIADVLLYFFGIFTPFLTLNEFVFFNQTMSLLESIHILYEQQQYGLAVIVGFFSLIFPIIKLSLLVIIWFLLRSDLQIRKWLRRIEIVGNWSMLDVFVVAITVVAIKLYGVGTMRVHYGLYLFASSVLLTKITMALIHALLDSKEKSHS